MDKIHNDLLTVLVNANAVKRVVFTKQWGDLPGQPYGAGGGYTGKIHCELKYEDYTTFNGIGDTALEALLDLVTDLVAARLDSQS